MNKSTSCDPRLPWDKVDCYIQSRNEGMPGDVEQWINGRGRDERLTIVGRNEEKSQTRQQAPEVAYDHEVWDRSLRNRDQEALYVVQSTTLYNGM